MRWRATPRRTSGSWRASYSPAPGKLSADGLADLLWCIAMLPEFQLIQ